MPTSDDLKRQKKLGSKRFGCLQVPGFVMAAVLVTAVVSFFCIKAYLFPSEFKPVVLTPTEEAVLAEKAETLAGLESSDGDLSQGTSTHQTPPSRPRTGTSMEPEPYSEKGLKREITFTERELNGLLAKNTDLAGKLAIDLSDNLISAKFRLPIDEDFPILGGQMLRLRSGVELSFKNDRPVVVLKGVTVMGIPVPNAWLGGIKNMDLVETFGDDTGFWKIFCDGIENIRVEKELLRVTLKE